MSEKPWMEVAEDELGIRETPGRDDTDRIVEYLMTTSYPVPKNYADEIPWCSAFVNWCLEKAGVEGTDSAWSQSWLEWGEQCHITHGAIVIFSWGNGRGHVGFVWRFNKEKILVLGGNQSNSVNITTFSYKNVKGYRLPST